MITQSFKTSNQIEQRHDDFEEIEQAWTKWCLRNAARYDTVTQAWSAFIREYQEQCLHFNSAAD